MTRAIVHQHKIRLPCGKVYRARIDEIDHRLVLVGRDRAWVREFEFPASGLIQSVHGALRQCSARTVALQLHATEYAAAQTSDRVQGLVEQLRLEGILLADDAKGLLELAEHLPTPGSFHAWSNELYGVIGPDFEPSRLAPCEVWRPIPSVVSALRLLQKVLAGQSSARSTRASEPLACTFAEWVSEAHARFGPDVRDWAFVCPCCGVHQTVRDYQLHGAPSREVAISCVRCWAPRPESDLGREARPSVTCTYSPGGVLQLNPVSVTMPTGDVVRVFAFSPLSSDGTAIERGQEVADGRE